MLCVDCPRHGSEVLLSSRQIVDLDSSDGTLTVKWVCWCGHRGTHRTGRARPRGNII